MGATTAGAQVVAPPLAGANVTNASVRDELGRPMGKADCFVNKLQLRMRPRDDGSFWVDQVNKSWYEVSTAKQRARRESDT